MFQLVLLCCLLKVGHRCTKVVVDALVVGALKQFAVHKESALRKNTERRDIETQVERRRLIESQAEGHKDTAEKHRGTSGET